MTIQEVKYYLNGARNVKKQLLILEQAESNVVEDAISIVPPYGKEYVDKGNVSRPTEEAAMKLEDLRTRIRNKKIDYTNILFDRVDLIDSALPLSSLDNRILKERYINSLSWNAISKQTLYNPKYLMAIHSRAVKKITRYVNENDPPMWEKRFENDK